MKIEEILVIGVNPDLKDTLLSMLPLDGQCIHNVDIYQLEIHSELRIFLYDLDLDHRIPVEFIDHIKPHLSGVLIVGDSTLSSNSIPKRDFINDITQELKNIPVIVAAGLDGEDNDNMSQSFKNFGFYLSKNSRLYFWKPDNIMSIKNIWRSLLVDLQEQKSAE